MALAITVKRLTHSTLLACLYAVPSMLTAQAASPPASHGPSRPAAGNHIYAQTLVNHILASDPQLMAVTIHITVPGDAAGSIIASTLDVIGNPDDPDDGEVTKLRRCIITPLLKLNKLGVMVPLKDRTGKEIGILALGFKYHDGDDETGPFSKAIAIRDRISKSIAGPTQLLMEVRM